MAQLMSVIDKKKNRFGKRPSEFCSLILRSQTNLQFKKNGQMSLKISFGCVSMYQANLFSFLDGMKFQTNIMQKRLGCSFVTWCQVIMNCIELLFILLILYFCSHQQTHKNKFNLRSVETCSFEVYRAQYVDLAGNFLGNSSFMYFYMADRKSCSQ